MDSSFRASAFAGLGAFAMSVIIALFSRVPLGALLVRALLSGLGFGGLFFGALWLLRRFLPDLFDDSVMDSATASGGTGSLVDIVLPGGDEERIEVSDTPDNTGQMVAARPPEGEAEVPVSASPDSGDLRREVASLRADTLVASDPGDHAAGDSALLRPSVGLDELDTLPDLDGLSDSFMEAQHGAQGDAEAGAPRGYDPSSLAGVSESMPTAGNPKAGTDPLVLAKAVQTLLRRDQKGQ